MAAEEGFEPSQTESESGVLPLHNSAKRKVIIMGDMPLVKCFSCDLKGKKQNEDLPMEVETS